MSVKASISLSEAQDRYARDLVARGQYASLSAVIQQGLELLRQQSQTTEALRDLLARRREEVFVPLSEGEGQTRAMIARKRAERDL